MFLTVELQSSMRHERRQSALLRAGVAGMTALLAEVAPELAAAAAEPYRAPAAAAASFPGAGAPASAAAHREPDPDAAAQTPFLAKLAFLEGLGLRETRAAAILWRSRRLRAAPLRRLQGAAAVLLGRAGVAPARLPTIIEEAPQARTPAAACSCNHGEASSEPGFLWTAMAWSPDRAPIFLGSTREEFIMGQLERDHQATLVFMLTSA